MFDYYTRASKPRPFRLIGSKGKEPFSRQQELNNIIIHGTDLLMVDPFKANLKQDLKTVHGYLAKRLKLKFMFEKIVESQALKNEDSEHNSPQKPDPKSETKKDNTKPGQPIYDPTFGLDFSQVELKEKSLLKTSKIHGFTHCEVLILLTYKKEVKDFMIGFLRAAGQKPSDRLRLKMEELYASEDKGLETNFRVGLRFNGKNFVVKKKTSQANLILTSVEEMIKSRGDNSICYEI